MPQVNVAYQADYSGGLNNTASPIEIAPNQAAVLQNWDITYQGQLVQRDGLTLVGNSISSNPITGGGAYIRTAGSDPLVIESTNLYYLNSSTWTMLANNLTAGDIWFENAQILNKIFFGNEDNVFSSWDRASTTLNTCITQLATTVPHGNVNRWFKNFMFTGNNVNVSGTKYPHRLYWSAVGDPTTWDTTNNYFEVPGDGRLITMMPMQDKLILFKERSIQTLTGYGNTNWQVTASNTSAANFSEQIGTLSKRGVCTVGNEIWYIDTEGNIRRLFFTDYNELRHDVVTTNVQGTLAGINKSQLPLATLWTNNNKVYACYPNGTDTHNSILLVFDLIASRRLTQGFYMPPTECWTTYTGWTPSLMFDFPTSTTPDLYICDGTTGKVYKHTGADDNGTAIAARWDGAIDYQKDPFTYKRYRFGRARAQSTTGSATVSIWASTDGAGFANVGNLLLTAKGTALGPTGTARMGPTGTWQLGGASQNEIYYDMANGGNNPQAKSLQMSIRHNEVGKKASFNSFATFFKAKDTR